MPITTKRSISPLSALAIGLAVALVLGLFFWLIGTLLGGLGMDIHSRH